MYEPLKIETCKKCKNVIAEPKELVRIVKSEEHEIYDAEIWKKLENGELKGISVGGVVKNE